MAEINLKKKSVQYNHADQLNFIHVTILFNYQNKEIFYLSRIYNIKVSRTKFQFKVLENVKSFY